MIVLRKRHPISYQKTMAKAIQIYNDEGSSPTGCSSLVQSLLPLSYPIEFIDAKKICTFSWEKSTALLIFPGGRDLPYHKKLKGEGNKRIRRFVEEGGRFLGICAGGYYGASKIEFAKNTPMEIIEGRELHFFPFAAIGPVFGSRMYRYDSEYGAQAPFLDFQNGKSFPVYYNGGCYFDLQEESSHIRIIASYKTVSRPAIVMCSVGKGKALLSGVHFELSSESLDLADPYLKNLYPLLSTFEKVREKFFIETISNLIN
jgi:glutamine amidotransferase-like uncharacterized protein